MNDGRSKWFIDRRFTVYTAIFFVLLTAFIGWRVGEKPRIYQNCNQIKLATGRSYIKQGDSLYQYRLDIPRNGIACE